MSPVEFTHGRRGRGGKGAKNHTTARKPGPLSIIQYSLNLSNEKAPSTFFLEIETQPKALVIRERTLHYHYLALCGYQLMEAGKEGFDWGGSVTYYVV